MKLIITEEQLRMIIENEDENLMDFTPFIDFNPNKWDDMFEHMNKKKGGIYDGYYINEDVYLPKYYVTELKYLVKVNGYLDLSASIDSLPILKSVGGYLNLNKSKISGLPKLESVGSSLYLGYGKIKSLPNLKSVGGHLYAGDSRIESLPSLESVGGNLYLEDTPLSKTTTKKELRKQINVKGDIYL